MLNRQRKLLLIDDNEVDLKINSKIITISKLFEEIVLCQSGKDGLAYLAKYAEDPDGLPDFILLDIQMPEMDGFEFLERFKNFPKVVTEKCLVAMLSSTLDFGDITKAEANPHVITLLKKPLFLKELEELLKK